GNGEQRAQTLAENEAVVIVRDELRCAVVARHPRPQFHHRPAAQPALRTDFEALDAAGARADDAGHRHGAILIQAAEGDGEARAVSQLSHGLCDEVGVRMKRDRELLRYRLSAVTTSSPFS